MERRTRHRQGRAAIALCLFALTVWAPRASADGDFRVAVIDVQGAVMRTEDGLRAQATLKKLFDRRQQQLDARQTQLQQARTDIEKQARLLSRHALQRRMETWQREMLELQTTFVDYNKELEKRQEALTAPIIQRIAGLSARIAKREGYSLIADKQAFVYARSDLDLTDRVIDMYNAGEAGDGND